MRNFRNTTAVLAALWLIMIAPGIMAQEPSLDEVLGRFYSAGKFDRLAGVRTVVMTGTIVQQDLMPVKIIRARPDKYLMEFDVADMTACQAFDGDTAWFTAPWTGNPAKQLAAGDRFNDLRSRADLDGALIGWKEKGHQAEMAGTDTVDGTPAFRIKVTRKDGAVEINCIDSKTWLLAKRIIYRQAGGREIAVESVFRDYREVEGIPFAFRVETNNGGRINELQFDEVRLNTAVDERIFSR